MNKDECREGFAGILAVIGLWLLCISLMATYGGPVALAGMMCEWIAIVLAINCR